MITGGWRVWRLPGELRAPKQPHPFDAGLAEGWDRWRHADGVPDGTPFLLDPAWCYDVELNAFFRSAEMLGCARNTQLGYARDLAAFLNFLWSARGRRSWRDATADDHLAYFSWRLRDEIGPRVAGSTWDREVAAVNRFYGWQVWEKNIIANPIPQRRRRPGAGRWSAAGDGGGERPATYTHGAGSERVEWLPAKSYRRWRDVGLRGYTPAGLPDPRFRGRWAARNATFADLMVRTGMRLSEQAGLSVAEVPRDRGSGGYRRFWLPAALAKGSSARWIRVPGSVVADLAAYVEIDRAEVVDTARARGRYQALRRPLVVDDPNRPTLARTAAGERVKVEHLDVEQRRRLLIDGPTGLEPAAFWLTEHGLPMAPQSWKDVFRGADARCRRHGLGLRCHPHMLRHSFAVITLEQLQRGQIAALAPMAVEQRGHYTRVFGDPLDWVRRALGHRSAQTTTIYLHALAELEMDTRMALIPDDWDDPRLTEPDIGSPDGGSASEDPAAAEPR